MTRILAATDPLPTNKPIVVTVGKFDGVHVGHQELIGSTVRVAKESSALSTVITFWPHPQQLFQPDESVKVIDTLEDRIKLLCATGVDVVKVQPFDQCFAGMTAESFLSKLVDDHQMIAMVSGPDARMGRDRHAGSAELSSICGRLGVRFEVIEQVGSKSQMGTRAVRESIQEADFASAVKALRRLPGLSGEVLHGKKRGRELGFPTLNVSLSEDVVLPPVGTYFVAVVFDLNPHKIHLGAANLGVRPTFDGAEQLLEVHLLDYDEMVYGQKVRVLFCRKLRDERKFASADDLVEQLRCDIASVRSESAIDTSLLHPWYCT
tara:strand:+ start:1183 stop:2145 length:963 start_codon:yes stop_codon:yes gene_type:complete